MYAVKNSNYRIANVLLHRGANFQILSHDGHSVLHLAARDADNETLKMLHSHKLRGLRIDLKAKNGNTALDYAEKRTDVGAEWVTAWEELVRGIMQAEMDDELECIHHKGGAFVQRVDNCIG